MKHIIITILGVLGFQCAVAQQLPATTFLQDLQYIWNPGFISPTEEVEISAYYRKEWIGFQNAPNTAFLGVQYPIANQNISLSGGILSDNTGPVSKLGLQLSTAYKLRHFFSEDDHLSVGIQGFFYQYKFDPIELDFTSPGEPLAQMKSTTFTPSLGLGMAYHSFNEEYAGENIFYFGASLMQLFESELVLADGTAPRVKHYFVNTGYKLFGFNNYIEPTIQVNYVSADLYYITVGARYEMEETFWGGLNYSTVNDLSINGGVMLNDIGDNGSFLKIGAIAGINTGQTMMVGPDFEFYIGYVFQRK